jgi:chromosome segregation ATPase
MHANVSLRTRSHRLTYPPAEREAAITEAEERLVTLNRQMLSVQAEALALQNQSGQLESDVKTSASNEERFQRVSTQLNSLETRKEDLRQAVAQASEDVIQLKESLRALQGALEKANHDRMLVSRQFRPRVPQRLLQAVA